MRYMPFGFQEAEGDSVLTLAAASATTSSGPIGSAGVSAYVLVMCQVTAITGTSPTVTFNLDESADGQSSWTAVTGATSAAINAAGSAVFYGRPAKSYVRVTATIGGTTPAVTANVAAITFAE